MALETWSPQSSAYGVPQKPEGDGWQLTGYNTVKINNPKMGSGFTTKQVPIYMRQAQLAPAAPTAMTQPTAAAAPTAPSNAFDIINQPITAADRAGQGVNTESVEDFMKRYNAQKDWVKAGMDITNWSPAGEIVKSDLTTPTPTQQQTDITQMLKDLQISSQMQMQQMMEGILGQQSAQMQQIMQTAEADRAARDAQMKQMAETQRTYAINQARSDAARNLQIEGASSAGGIGGTDPFKIRQQSGKLFGSTPIKLASTLNI